MTVLCHVRSMIKKEYVMLFYYAIVMVYSVLSYFSVVITPGNHQVVNHAMNFGTHSVLEFMTLGTDNINTVSVTVVSFEHWHASLLGICQIVTDYLT